jgi:hypothetical protein
LSLNLPCTQPLGVRCHETSLWGLNCSCFLSHCCSWRSVLYKPSSGPRLRLVQIYVQRLGWLSLTLSSSGVCLYFVVRFLASWHWCNIWWFSSCFFCLTVIALLGFMRFLFSSGYGNFVHYFFSVILTSPFGLQLSWYYKN